MGDVDGRSAGLIAVALLAGVLAACGTTSKDTGPLEKDGFQPAEVTKLPGGGKVSVGSPDGHDVVVQWQGKGSSGWSDARTVYTEPDQFTHDISVTAAGDTVAIDPDFWTEETLDDDYAPNHTAQVICRGRECADGHRSPDGVLSGTELADSGAHASFALGGDQVLLWDDGTFSTETVVGLPDGATSRTLPDGSSAAIVPEQHGSLCRYRLLTSEVGRTAYVARAVSDDHPTLLPCSISGVEVAGDRVSVLVEELGDSVDFVRSDGTWTADEPASPLQAYPDTRGISSLANHVASRTDDSDVSIGSPDMKRIFAQFRAKGSKEWTEPVQVATAPAGTLCRFQLVDRDQLVVADMISCFDADQPFELGTTEPTKGIALATSDGRTWETREVDRPSAEVSTGAGQDKLFRGASATWVWSPSSPMRRIDLPVGPRDGLVTTSDGRVIRTVGDVLGGTACRPGYQVADLDATSWSRARRFPDTAGVGDDAAGCSSSMYHLDGAVQVTIGNQAWEGAITLEDGDWIARKVTY